MTSAARDDRSANRAGRSTMQQLIAVFFFQAEDGIRDKLVTGVQTCALPISSTRTPPRGDSVTLRRVIRSGRGSAASSLTDSRIVRSATRISSWAKAAPMQRRRSEERRVGKECGARWPLYRTKKILYALRLRF